MGEYKDISKDFPKAEEPAIAYHDFPTIERLSELSAIDASAYSYSGEIIEHLSQETGISLLVLANIIGISKSKIYDLAKLKQLDEKTIDALADFACLWKVGLEAFDGNLERYKIWLDTLNPNLGQHKPIVFFQSRLGRRSLEKAFQRIEYGLYG